MLKRGIRVCVWWCAVSGIQYRISHRPGVVALLSLVAMATGGGEQGHGGDAARRRAINHRVLLSCLLIAPRTVFGSVRRRLASACRAIDWFECVPHVGAEAAAAPFITSDTRFILDLGAKTPLRATEQRQLYTVDVLFLIKQQQTCKDTKLICHLITFLCHYVKIELFFYIHK